MSVDKWDILCPNPDCCAWNEIEAILCERCGELLGKEDCEMNDEK